MKGVIRTMLLVMLAGCATTQEALDQLNRRFLGQNVDAFFVQYGAPTGRHTLNSGDIMYLWNSEVRSYYIPPTTTVQGTRTPYGFTGTAQTTGGVSVNVYCEMQVLTGPDGTVKSFSPRVDTIGRWTTSRCAEVFKE